MCLVLYVTMLFFWERETGEAGNIRSDLKKCNASWSTGHRHLARETLTNKLRGLCDQNAGVVQTTPALCHL